MTAKLLASACGLAFTTLAAPAFAQDASAPAGPAEQQPGLSASEAPFAGISDAAKSQAEQVGIQNVEPVRGATVLKGASPSNAEIYMIVGRSGELLALAAPLPGQSGGQTPSAGSEVSAGDYPDAAEPAQSGYLATQTQPATPNMWDPGAVEGAMQQLELGTRGAVGEVIEEDAAVE